MKKIFWIASYPRSGNTWMRAILSSLFFTETGKFNLNLLKNIVNFDNPDKYEFIKNLNLNDFNRLNEVQIISKYWVEAQRRAKINGDFAFFKTHSGNVTMNKHKYTVPENVLGLIYLIRDPRDVLVSYSKYSNKSLDDTIRSMTSKICMTWSGLPKEKPYPILLSSWDIHYQTWKLLEVPKLTIKYESLLSETEKTLWSVVDFFAKNYGFKFKNIKKKINNILETTTFDNLKKTERVEGFDEAPYIFSKKQTKEFFFRKGKNNQWKSILSNKQLDQIEKSFFSTMKELGYIK